MSTHSNESLLAQAVAAEIVSSDPSARAYVQSFFSGYGDTIRSLCDTSAFTRLAGVSQHGLKWNTRLIPPVIIPFCGRREGDARPLGAFDRRTHSVRVCGTAIAFCAMHRVPFAEALHLSAASLFHDLGHPAFSHVMEPVFHALGLPDHETVGQRVALEDPEIRERFVLAGIDANRVVSIMREEGDLGLRQKLVDTCAYLVHDAALGGFSIDRAFATNLLRSVNAVEDGAYAVSDASALREFLDRRAMMMTALYKHPFNRVADLLFCSVVEWLVRSETIQAESLLSIREHDLLAVVDRVVLHGAPGWLRSANTFLRKYPIELRCWKISGHADERAARKKAMNGTPARPCLLLPPSDEFGKSLPIALPDGSRSVLSVPSSARPDHHKHWHVVIYAGPV